MASSERCEGHECVREQDRSFSFVAVVGNAASASVMGAGAQEDEEETTMVAEGGVREEEEAAAEGAGEEQQLGQGGGGEGGEEKAAPVMSCSICLDTVVAGGEERSTARLQCGHEFHLGERLRCLEISRLFLDCATHVFGSWEVAEAGCCLNYFSGEFKGSVSGLGLGKIGIWEWVSVWDII